MKVDANRVELPPLVVDGILELLRHIEIVQNFLDHIVRVPVHKLVHELFDLQNSVRARTQQRGLSTGEDLLFLLR
jgi:hypothetical protein